MILDKEKKERGERVMYLLSMESYSMFIKYFTREKESERERERVSQRQRLE